MEIVNAMTVRGFGQPCYSVWFCSACRGRTCIICCEDHAARHHGDAGANLLGIDMLKGMPAILARQVKVRNGNLGYDWSKIHSKNVSGQDVIFINRQPNDRRLKGQCKNCGDRIRAKSDYCCPVCKVAQKPNGQNTDLIQNLIDMNFTQDTIRDVFCLSCLRAFSTAHCPNHAVHVHGADGEGGAGPVLVEIVEHEGWKLIPEDVIGLPPHLDRLKRIAADGVLMVAVCRRLVPDTHGANSCENLRCRESVDQAGDICSLQCLFSIQLLIANEDEEEDEDEEPESPPQDSDEDEEE